VPLSNYTLALALQRGKARKTKSGLKWWCRESEGLKRVAGSGVWRQEPIRTKWGRDDPANGETPSRRQWREAGEDRRDEVCPFQGPQDGLDSSVRECINSFRSWMRGFHARLREKPSSLFMFPGWSSISIASLKT
jgi:hypothetical protein